MPPLAGEWRDLSTSTKSTVLFSDCPQGPLVAKSAPLAVLRKERWAYELLLPTIGLPGPRVRGWFESGDRAWLITDFVRGRPPVLWERDDQLRVTRWVARLHHRSRGTSLLPPEAAERPTPEVRIAEVVRELSQEEEVDHAALEHCREVEHALPLVRQAGEGLPGCITHGDISDWNIVMSADVTVLDWERASHGPPSIDLAWCDIAEYARELRRSGERTDSSLLARAKLSGIVLACLAHDVARKPMKAKLRYIARMIDAVRELKRESGAADAD